jgi:hypothetical protein
MIVALLAVALAVSALMLWELQRDRTALSAAAELPDADLPCPWCLAQTEETDSACPSCGQAFGPGR